MPVYEFYCPDCHMIFSFFSRRINTDKHPACPKCDRPDLERRTSRFAISKGLTESADGPLPDIDEAKLERALGMLAGQADSIDQDDPRQAAQLMKQLAREAGIPLGHAMEEAIQRMESGEDPDMIEQEMGDSLEEDDPFSTPSAGGRLRTLRKTLLPPSVDETLYEL